MIEDLLAHLRALTHRADGTGYRDAALAQILPDGHTQSWMFGGNGHVGSRVRTASMSKAATAHAALTLVLEGQLSLDADIGDILAEHTLPQACYQRPIAVRHLLNHTSGLSDDAGYIIDPNKDLFDFLMANAGEVVSGRTPGSFFCYANMNYLLLGHVIEAITEARFDLVIEAHVLRAANIQGGFNWCGVSVPDRDNHLALYQRQQGKLVRTADHPDTHWEAELIWRDGRGIDISAYVPGAATSIFSPHSGLRATVAELARLARLIGGDSPVSRLQREETWRFDPDQKNGEDCDGLFTRFGHGLTIYRDHPLIPSHLVGHAGHALGLTGGLWHNMDSGVSWAYFLTGAPDLTQGLNHEVFYDPDELAIMRAL